MDANALVAELRKKFNAPNNTILAKRLGVSHSNLQNLSSGQSSFTPTKLANLITKAKEQGKREVHNYGIKPIIEFYPVEITETAQGGGWEIFNPEESGVKRQQRLKRDLCETIGIYIFFDSRGEALYVGKAKNQSLWCEINNAFNRDRETQKIKSVAHAFTGVGPGKDYEASRHIRAYHVRLCDLAQYFSAYEVDYEMVNNIEALLIRTFANTLLNTRVEKFSNTKC